MNLFNSPSMKVIRVDSTGEHNCHGSRHEISSFSSCSLLVEPHDLLKDYFGFIDIPRLAILQYLQVSPSIELRLNKVDDPIADDSLSSLNLVTEV